MTNADKFKAVFGIYSNVEKSAMYEAFAGISPEPPKEETCTKN